MSDTADGIAVATRLSLRKLAIATLATLVGLVATWVVLTAKSEPQAGAPPERPAPMVEVITAAPADHQLRVRTQGTVRAKTQVELAAQVMVVVDLATRSMWSGASWAYDPETGATRAL